MDPIDPSDPNYGGGGGFNQLPEIIGDISFVVDPAANPGPSEITVDSINFNPVKNSFVTISGIDLDVSETMLQSWPAALVEAQVRDRFNRPIPLGTLEFSSDISGSFVDGTLTPSDTVKTDAYGLAQTYLISQNLRQGEVRAELRFAESYSRTAAFDSEVKPPVLELSYPKTAAVGDDVVLVLELENALNFTGGNVRVSWDPAYLTPDLRLYEEADLTVSGVNTDNAAGWMDIDVFSSLPVSGNISLVRVILESTNTGQAAITANAVIEDSLNRQQTVYGEPENIDVVPVITLPPEMTAVEGEVVAFTPVVSGSTDGYTFAWNFGDGNSIENGNAQVAYTYGDNGTFNASITGTSSIGLPSITAATVVTVINADPVVSLPQSSYTVLVGTVLDVSCSITDGGSADTHTVEWDFGDGNTLSGTETAVSNSYFTAGEYTLTVTVTDDDGGSAAATAVVTVMNPVVDSPVAVISSVTPNQGEPGETVLLDGTGSTGQGTLSYNWAQTAGEPGTFSDPQAAAPAFTLASTASTLVQIKLTVTSTLDDGRILTSEPAYAFIMVSGLSANAQISGTVRLTNRSDSSGAEVTLENESEIFAVETDAQGYFTLEVPAGTYQVTASCPNYLPAITEVTILAGEVRSIGTATLTMGDLNGDGVIDIFDMVILAQSYGETASRWEGS